MTNQTFGDWKILDDGLEGPGEYFIEASRLGERHRGFLDWPLHMAEKGWVNVEDFCAAFRAAVERFKPRGVSKADVEEAIALACEERADQIARRPIREAVEREMFPDGIDPARRMTAAFWIDDLEVIEREVERRLRAQELLAAADRACNAYAAVYGAKDKAETLRLMDEADDAVAALMLAVEAVKGAAADTHANPRRELAMVAGETSEVAR